VLGWKEYEMEVVRDKADNCIIVCAIENVDPMGVHTGDSITVAPALTLTDKEYQIMRDASLAVLREIGVETGGSNVSSRSTPMTAHGRHRDEPARVALLGAGLQGDGLPDRQGRGAARGRLHAGRDRNDITGGATPASFEPTIDYVVTKIPRFAFEKFPAPSRR
jgi:carbamoyl-phosphate synthase large subunit